MAADCHPLPNTNHQLQYLYQVEPSIWKACAGTSVQIPETHSRVYYFPQGHIEHSSPQPSISAFSRLPPRPFVLCRVLQVLYLVDPDTDEVYSRIRLDPRANADYFLSQRPTSSSPSSVAGFRLPVAEGAGDAGSARKEEGSAIVSFAKVLTPSDANNGGGFSVPRFCADSIFPPLDYEVDPPVQNVTITDMRGKSWDFRHIYRGTPRRHLLTTGWSKFVNSKKLISGDSVVFMKNKITGKMFVGIRRALKSTPAVDVSPWAQQYGAMGIMSVEEGGSGGIMRAAGGDREAKLSRNGKGKVPPESVVEAVELAANNMPFEVVYYPKAGSQDFVVAAEKVEQALGVCWTPGMRVRMAMETEDSSRLTWFQGTVSSVSAPDYGPWQRSLWRMLQVAWDEHENLENINRVSPWQVEYVSPTPPIDAAFPPAKKFRLPQNCGFLTDGEADLPLPNLPPMGFGNSMIGPLSSSYLNYSTFPAGMQGARQDAFRISSLANIFSNGSRPLYPVGYADNNLVQKAEAVSTDLNIGSSQSEAVSPNSSSSALSFSSEAAAPKAGSSAPKAARTSIQLFGQTIHMDCPVESPNHVGSRENGVNKRNMENKGLRNPLDLCLSDPQMKLLDRIDVQCPAAQAIESYSLSMAR